MNQSLDPHFEGVVLDDAVCEAFGYPKLCKATPVFHNGNAYFQASRVQKSIWFLQAISGESSYYNVTFGMRFVGSNLGRLRVACERTVERHESLRTYFALVGGDLMQTHDDAGEVQIGSVNLRGLVGIEQEIAFDALFRDYAGHGFDLEGELLVRMVLVELSDNEHALILTAHHVIIDGWSIQILMRDIERFYFADTVHSATAYPYRYSDFCEWSNELEKTEIFEGQLEWRETRPCSRFSRSTDAARTRSCPMSVIAAWRPFLLRRSSASMNWPGHSHAFAYRLWLQLSPCC
jgi:hypothetical protein